MERATFTIPGMWADHHVLAVRAVLDGLPGISGVFASAMKKQVSLDFDPKVTTAEAIGSGLAAAGYAPGEVVEAGAAPKVKIAWDSCGFRVTCTNPADQALSGDFRKY